MTAVFLGIGEAAEQLGLPQHVLRFWEGRFAQVRPVKRANGRRFYRAQDIQLLKGIRHLLHGQGMTIRGAQRFITENGLDAVRALGRGEAGEAEPAGVMVKDVETSPAGDLAGLAALPLKLRSALMSALGDAAATRELAEHAMQAQAAE